MSTVRPKDVIAEIDRFYPRGLDGTGVIPLADQTVVDLQNILNLVERVPQILLPNESDRVSLNRVTGLIREGIEKVRSRTADVRTAGSGFSLPNIREDGGRNPLAVLRDVLSRCQNLTPKEVRRRLLELIASFDRAGTIPFRDTSAIGPLSLVLAEIRKQMDLCEHEGSISLERTQVGYDARLTPAGWLVLEEPDSAEPPGGSCRTVFISCGQFTEAEIVLGKTLTRLVNDLTPYDGYFAQNQSGLDGLTSHIFGALNASIGFVAVMHHRGTVRTLTNQQIRASVWVEQEIAIAAFLVQAQSKALSCVVYIQEGIALEGVRQQLLLGPVFFKDDGEVIEDFRRRLQNGLFGPGAAGVRS